MWTVGKLLLPQFVTCAHPFKRFLHMESADHDRVVLTVIIVEVINGSDARFRLAGILGRPMHLVVVFDRSRQIGTLVNEDVVPATVCVSF